jgi:uncharacterized protein YaaR (DUF327 family)
MTGDSKDKKKKSVLEKEVDEGKKNWIKDAIKKPGQLHKDLGVPKDEKIPTKKLNTAAEKGGKVGERARLAKTLKGLHEDKKEIKEWVESLVENDYHCITTKSEIMELIETKLMEQSPDVDVPVKEPKTRPNEKPGVGKPDTGKPLHNPWKKDLPNVQPGPKFNTEPDVDVPVKEPKTTPTEKPGVGKPDTGKPLHNPWKKDLPNVQPGPKFRGEPMPNFLSKDSIMGAIKQNQVNEISSRILQSIKNGKKNI